MRTVQAHVYGKDYTLACDDGQEPHLRQLVEQVNLRAQRLEKAVGKLPETMMMLYTALMTADELHDLSKENAKLKDELAKARSSSAATPDSDARIASVQQEMADNLTALAKRLDGLAEKLAA